LHWPGWRPSRLAIRSPGSGPWDGRDTCRPSRSSPQYSPNGRLTPPEHLSHLGLRVVLAQLRDLGVAVPSRPCAAPVAAVVPPSPAVASDPDRRAGRYVPASRGRSGPSPPRHRMTVQWGTVNLSQWCSGPAG
jgi:hypothetical protein